MTPHPEVNITTSEATPSLHKAEQLIAIDDGVPPNIGPEEVAFHTHVHVVNRCEPAILGGLLHTSIAPSKKPQHRVIRRGAYLTSKLSLPKIFVERHSDV
jgi:hypothetical protein